MSRQNALTRSEIRLATLLLILSLLGLGVRGVRRLDPRVEAWLAEAPEVTAAAPGSSSPPSETVSGTPEGPGDRGVDPNSADASELTRLPGVGPVLAARIVQDREQRGGYTRPEDLLRVPGIGPRTLERIRAGLRFPASPGG